MKTDALLRKFRQEVPGIAIRTSLIIGYPGETKKIFKSLNNGLTILLLIVWVYLHTHTKKTHMLIC